MMSFLRGVRALPLTALLALLVATQAAAQPAVTPPPANTDRTEQVTVDLAAGAFDRELPFDVPFFIAGRAPVGTRSLDVQYAVAPESGDTSNLIWTPGEPARWRPVGPSATDEAFLLLVRVPLEAGRDYRVRFTLVNERPAENASVIAYGRTAHGNYVSVDAGVLYSGTIGIGAVYVGGNIYFRPINKRAPLGELTRLGRRLALTVGATVSSVADEENGTRSGLFWNQGLVLGVGYRVTSSVRAGGGALVFQEANPNPLISTKRGAATWYASISVDLNLVKQ